MCTPTIIGGFYGFRAAVLEISMNMESVWPSRWSIDSHAASRAPCAPPRICGNSARRWSPIALHYDERSPALWPQSLDNRFVGVAGLMQVLEKRDDDELLNVRNARGHGELNLGE